MDTDFSDDTEGEPGSGLRLYDPTKRVALKLRAHLMLHLDRKPAFFVEHLSGLDFSMRLSKAEHLPRAQQQLARTSADQAARACAQASASKEHPRLLPRSAALFPYWDGRNSITHNAASHKTVIDRLHATMCAASNYFEDVIIGACSDLGPGTHVFEHHGVPNGVRAQLVPLKCESGPFLIYRLLQHAQAQLRSGRWRYEYLFYSEADQILHLSRVDITTLANVLRSHSRGGREAYLTPNRLEEIYEPETPKLADINGDKIPFRGPDIEWDNRTFAIAVRA